MIMMTTKFRIVKVGWLSYDAEASYNCRDWVKLGNFLTKSGAKQKCVDFAKYLNRDINTNIVEEFEL